MIHIVAGVPGSGKSWVCNQLSDKFNYIRHDDYGDLIEYSDWLQSSRHDHVLGDCPFAERKLKEHLEACGEVPQFYFILEAPEVIEERYSLRGTPIPKGHLTRLNSIPDRAAEWGAFIGTSQQVLDKLRSL